MIPWNGQVKVKTKIVVGTSDGGVVEDGSYLWETRKRVVVVSRTMKYVTFLTVPPCTEGGNVANNQ